MNVIINGREYKPVEQKPEIPEGFTAWHGGECPVADDVMVNAFFRGEYISSVLCSHELYWGYTGSSGDIIAYRIVKPTTFTLNGEVLPRADYVGKRQSLTDTCVHFGHTNMWYKSREDADKVRAAFAKLGEGL